MAPGQTKPLQIKISVNVSSRPSEPSTASHLSTQLSAMKPSQRSTSLKERSTVQRFDCGMALSGTWKRPASSRATVLAGKRISNYWPVVVVVSVICGTGRPQKGRPVLLKIFLNKISKNLRLVVVEAPHSSITLGPLDPKRSKTNWNHDL